MGEAPAKHEFEEGRNFAGPSGQVMWPMVWRECGLSREYCWVTNLLKIDAEPWKKGEIPADILDVFGAELEAELELVRPEIIVPVGGYAARHFLGEWANMQTCNARAWRRLRPWGEVLVLPIMHPAAAMRDSTQLAWTHEGLKALRQTIDGRPPLVPEKHSVWVFNSWRDYWAGSEDPSPICGLDTEWTTDGEPWGLSFAVDPDFALVLRAGNTNDILQLRAWLAKHRPRVAMHYALADLDPLRRMGIDIRAMGLELVDTNILAFHRQTEPQGLKALCRRWLGLEMRDYEDVVGPYHEVVMKAYLTDVLESSRPIAFERWGKPTKAGVRKRLKDGVEPASKIHSLVKRCFGDAERGVAVNYGTRWKNWLKRPDGICAEIEAAHGPAPKMDLRLVPDAEAEQYAGEDAAGTVGILRALEAVEGTGAVTEAIDHDRLGQIDDMQRNGLEVDLVAHEKLKAYITDELAEALESLRLVTGRDDFDPGKPDQVREVLFGLKKVSAGQYIQLDDDDDYVAPVAFTKGQKLPSTDKKSLSLLSGEHVLPPLLLYWRSLEKLRSTYIDPLPGFLRLEAGQHILHPRYSTVRVPSGRLAARDPNIMAFPKRSKLGKMVRALFRARAGRLFGAWDHGQIELRVMADDARDEAMIAELLPGAADMHRSNAKLFFGLDGDVWDEAYWAKGGAADTARDCSKIITYGIAYGAEERRLHFEALVAGFTQYSVDDFGRFRRDWFKKYAGVAAMVEETAKFARQHGYIEDRWGRRRKSPAAMLSGMRWPVNKMREEAIRQLQNHRVQGGAQGFMARAQIRVQNEVIPELQKRGVSLWMLLQIHDELMAEFEQGHWDEVNEAMTWAMTADSWMVDCGIITDSAQGATWDVL